MANVQIKKTVFKKDDFNKAVDTEFSTFTEPIIEVDNDTVEELFRLYNKLYFEIPVEGDVNSHRYIIQESSKLVEFTSDLEDIQPLLENDVVLNTAITDMGVKVNAIPDYWVGIESRGFIFASALSLRWGGGVKLIRKKGKLPPVDLVTEQYELEYGVDIIQMKKGSGSVVIVDDVLATGGTMNAAEKIVSAAGYELLDKIVLLDIGLIESDIKSIISYV